MISRMMRAGVALLWVTCGLLGVAQANGRVRPQHASLGAPRSADPALRVLAGGRAPSEASELIRFVLQDQSSRTVGGEPCDLGQYIGLAFEGGKLVPAWADNSVSLPDNPDHPNRILEIATNVVTVGDAPAPAGVTNLSQTAGPQWNPSVAIDPTNPQRIVMASQTAGGLFAAVSVSGGQAWTHAAIPAPAGYDVGAPSVAFDAFGNCLLAFVARSSDAVYEVVVARSSNGGATFNLIGSTSDVFPDLLQVQPVIVTGPIANGAAPVWLTWRNGSGSLSVRRANSTGLNTVSSFGPPETLGMPGSIQGNYGDLTVGPHGEVLTVYQDALSDEGPSRLMAQLNPDGAPGHWGAPYQVTATNVGNSDRIPAQPACGIDAEPGLAWDRGSGRVYLVYVDEVVNESDDTDVMLRYSDDRGATWSDPIRVNDDATTRSQFNPRIAVDQSTGDVAITWLDCRADVGNMDAQVYGALIHRPAVLSFEDDASAPEGLEASLVVRLSSPPAIPVSVDYAAIPGGTAQAGADYTLPPGTLTFPAGVSLASISILANQDRLIEPDETVLVGLSNVSGPATLVDPTTATVTIHDDRASTRPTNVTATPSDLSSILVAWTDNCDNETDFLVEASQNGGAFAQIGTAPADSLSFLATGLQPDVAYSFRVKAHLDGVGDSDPSGPATAILSYCQISLDSTAYAGTEGHSVDVGVVRAGSTSQEVSVRVVASPVTANTSDFTAVDQRVTIPAGTSRADVTVPLTADRLLEPDETLQVVLSDVHGTGTTLASPAAATVTIKDDPEATAPAGLTVNEEAPGSYRLSWTDNCDNETGYSIERRAGLSAAFTVLFQAPANSTTFLDTADLDPKIQYFYRVKAVSNGIESGYSETVQTISGAKVTIAPKQLKFGTVKVGAGKSMKLTITNTSKVVVTGNVDPNGLSASFRITSGVGAFTLNPKEKHGVVVAFTPTGAGAVNGVFHLETRTAKNPTTIINVAGKGK